MPERQPTRRSQPSGLALRPTLCPPQGQGTPVESARAAPAALTPLPTPVAMALPPPAPTWGRRRVLLLNTTFEPLTALPLRRAVVLVVCGKAEVVHGDPTGMIVHSATASVQVPSVIRLSSYVRVPYRGRVPLTRAGLMHRDRYRCAYCGGRAETIDHVIPRSRGGQHTWQNCVACCARCNHKKADKLLADLGWRLRVIPNAPRGPHWRLLAGVTDADPLWLPYLGEAA